jgi:hypothetical protein
MKQPFARLRRLMSKSQTCITAMVLTAPRDARSPDGAPAHGATLSMKGDPGGNLADEHGFSAVASKSPVVDDA